MVAGGHSGRSTQPLRVRPVMNTLTGAARGVVGFPARWVSSQARVSVAAVPAAVVTI